MEVNHSQEIFQHLIDLRRLLWLWMLTLKRPFLRDSAWRESNWITLNSCTTQWSLGSVPFIRLDPSLSAEEWAALSLINSQRDTSINLSNKEISTLWWICLITNRMGQRHWMLCWRQAWMMFTSHIRHGVIILKALLRNKLTPICTDLVSWMVTNSKESLPPQSDPLTSDSSQRPWSDQAKWEAFQQSRMLLSPKRSWSILRSIWRISKKSRRVQAASSLNSFKRSTSSMPHPHPPLTQAKMPSKTTISQKSTLASKNSPAHKT